MQRGITMNDNIINILEGNTVNNFDFSQEYKVDESLNTNEEDDIIIVNKKDEEFEDDFKLEDTIIDIDEQPQEPKTELDNFFDSIYNGVEDANELITEINLKKKTLSETEKELSNLKEQINREKIEFSKYMDSQREALLIERNQLKEKAELQKLRIEEENAQVKNDIENRTNELILKEQKLKVEQEKLEMQKINFEKYKEVEEEKIKNELNKLNIEKEQFEKEKELSYQTIENNKKELEIEKEHFSKIKEIEESKIESERANLTQNCERFKRLISGLSKNFNNMPNE